MLALVLATGIWQPLAKADGNSKGPAFAVDPFWPKPLPAPVGADGVAHTWVTGEIAGSCMDKYDNVYTFNRGWEVGNSNGGPLQGNELGAIVGQDASASAIPSPPVVAYNSEAKQWLGGVTRASFKAGPITDTPHICRKAPMAVSSITRATSGSAGMATGSSKNTIRRPRIQQVPMPHL